MSYELVTQCRVLRLQCGKTLTERVNRLGNLQFGEARSDVLRAVPVEGIEPQPQDPLELRFIGNIRDQLSQSGVRVARQLSTWA